jgi:arylsulfatase A-like enzyme
MGALLLLAAACTVLGCLVPLQPVGADELGVKSKPSAVFILVDDLGHNDVAYNNRSADGSTAGRKIISPNIDEMADTGIKLLHYYVQPICTPTRSALMTGRYAFRWGATGYTIGSQDPWGVPLDETFFPELLQARGWVTAVFGKWHVSRCAASAPKFRYASFTLLLCWFRWGCSKKAISRPRAASTSQLGC